MLRRVSPASSAFSGGSFETVTEVPPSGFPWIRIAKLSFVAASFATSGVRWVKHWNEHLFSFAIERPASFRFRSGEFVMIGLMDGDRPLMRAYSIASAHYEEHLEFFSIKVPNGPLTSRLQHLKPGDPVIVSRKPTGTLVLNDLKPGKHLYLVGTGTGLAPFLSIIRDPETYERFDKIVLAHGVRHIDDLAYADYLELELPQHDRGGMLPSWEALQAQTAWAHERGAAAQWTARGSGKPRRSMDAPTRRSADCSTACMSPCYAVVISRR